MRATNAVSIIVLASTLLACGGGGGGGSSSPPPAGGNPPPVNPPPPNPPPANPPPPPPASTGVGTAQIVFPWQHSSAVGSTVVVRGTAADPDGVAAVRVNGLSAALSAVSSGSPKATRTLEADFKTASVLAAAEDTDVEWEVEVELETGETDLVVTVEDETGDETEGAAEASIKYAEVPSIFTSEVGDPRLLGWSSSITGMGAQLVQFDMATGEQTVYPELHDIGIATCFRSQQDQLLYIVGAWDDWHLRRFDLTTRQRTEVADLSALLTAGPGFSSGPFLVELVCSSSREHAYVLANYAEQGNWWKSRVVEVALSGNAQRILTETLPADPAPRWIARRMSMTNDALITLPEFNSAVPLTRIALDGTRTPLAPTINVDGLAIAALPDASRVYVTTFAGVDEVIVTPPSKKNISEVPPTEPLIFSQANSIGLDLVDDKVVVGDADLDAVIAVDRVTGERSELISRKLGAGPPLIAPRGLAVTADGGTVYVADDGGNAAERLFEIDLATGDRSAVGQIHDPGVNRSLPGLVLDEQNGDVYLIRYGEAALLYVRLETEEVEIVPLSGAGLLQQIEDIALDAEQQRLLAVDSATESIVAVDLVTRQQELISRAGARGDGPAFETLASLTLAENGTALYVADQGTDEILRVDLELGHRELLETACALGVHPQSLQQVLYDGEADELLIVDTYGVFVHDFETSQCTKLPIPVGLPILGIELTPDGRLLAAGFHAVLQIDRKSGDVVIVSK